MIKRAISPCRPGYDDARGTYVFVLSQIRLWTPSHPPNLKPWSFVSASPLPRPLIITSGALSLLFSLNYQSLALSDSGGSLVSQSLGLSAICMGRFSVHNWAICFV